MKTPEILENLRKRIVGGEFPPGSRLPTRPELLAEYSVSVSAFQKCVNQLIAWGFLESRGMYGMCVTANPPHLARFAVLLPTASASLSPETDSFLTGFCMVLKEYQKQHKGLSFVFFAVGSLTTPRQDEFERFAEEAERGLFAGAISIFTVPPEEIRQRLANFPCVVVSRKREDTPHNYPQIEFDWVALFQAQLSFLEAKGCGELAVLIQDTTSTAKLLEIMKIATQSKAHLPRRRILGMNTGETRPILFDNLLELMFTPENGVITDGLIVMNGNFLPQVFATFARLKIVPGKDVKIVSHANYPLQNHVVESVDVIGFSVERILQAAMERLQKWKTYQPAEKADDLLILPDNIK